VEPQIRRIGQYKSAGDQLLRTDMSSAQREATGAIVDDVWGHWVADVAAARGKTNEEVEAMLHEGVFDAERFVEGGWLDGLMYEDELNDAIKARTGGKEDELRAVNYTKYQRVGRSAFAPLTGKKTIAVVRASGAIVASGSGSGSITAGPVIRQLRALAKDKKVAAVIIRVDSPGGDALASDLMWREVTRLATSKPVIASMSDVAASGGYYLSMGAHKVVAEALTLTGSIGVVTGKFNLEELYKKAGYSKETISK
jgi:protease IV